MNNQADEGVVGVSGDGNGVLGKGLLHAKRRVCMCIVNLAIKAIYEGGKLRPLEPLMLAEHTVVEISLATDDAERREWLAQSERSLMNTWDNEADDVYNALLTK